jgi:predicted ArsR family transcriptional regulator
MSGIDEEIVRTDLLDNTYHSTRSAIIALLKKKGEVSMKELATELGISKMAVSKHLSTLERDRLVKKTSARTGVGRPEYRYTLTSLSHHLFPTSYPYIATSAISFIEEQLGNEGVLEFFRKRRNELIERYSKRLSALDFEEKVTELAKIREEEGFLAQAEKSEEGMVLTEYNCPMLSVACKYNQACVAELELFSMLLNADVERTHWMAGGNHMCRYLIKKKAAKTEPTLY